MKDARDLPREVLALQATSPNTFAVTALDRHRFAWVKPAGPNGPDSLLVAEPLTVQNWFKAEWPRGSVTGWPETISECTFLGVRVHVGPLSGPPASCCSLQRLLAG